MSGVAAVTAGGRLTTAFHYVVEAGDDVSDPALNRVGGDGDVCQKIVHAKGRCVSLKRRAGDKENGGKASEHCER